MDYHDEKRREEYRTWVDRGYTTYRRAGMLALHNNGYETLRKHGATTVYEIGSGLGYFLAASEHASGYDMNGYSRRFAVEDLGVDPGRYRLGMPKRFPRTDAIYCVEVLEHLTDEQISNLLKRCEAPLFYFTSTPRKADNDAAWGHINIKREDDWIEVFARYGYELECRCQAVTPWGLVFRRT